MKIGFEAGGKEGEKKKSIFFLAVITDKMKWWATLC